MDGGRVAPTPSLAGRPFGLLCGVIREDPCSDRSAVAQRSQSALPARVQNSIDFEVGQVEQLL